MEIVLRARDNIVEIPVLSKPLGIFVCISVKYIQQYLFQQFVLTFLSVGNIITFKILIG